MRVIVSVHILRTMDIPASKHVGIPVEGKLQIIKEEIEADPLDIVDSDANISVSVFHVSD
jgi:hypothetical protein